MSELSHIDINFVDYNIKDAQARSNINSLFAASVVSGSYNSTNRTIELKNTSNAVVSTIPADDFIKDGMVSSVAIVNGNLVISFNTDAGKSPISIPLTDIFDPSNYYTKSQTDAKLDVLASDVNVKLTLSPATIYKGYAQEVTLTGVMENATPTNMKLMDGDTVIAKSSSSPITGNFNVNTTSLTKVFGVRGTFSGITFKGRATLNARYPIYYGFGASASAVAIDANRYAATTTAAHTYQKTAVADGQHFYILVPSDISALNSFTMGGAPFVMTASTDIINGITYKVYTSGNVYNSATTVKVTAS